MIVCGYFCWISLNVTECSLHRGTLGKCLRLSVTFSLIPRGVTAWKEATVKYPFKFSQQGF